MKIAIACDHRGVSLKEKIQQLLTSLGHEWSDYGTNSEDSVDYTDHIFPAAEEVSQKRCDGAIGICYTGIGSSIAANKVKGVRASLCREVKEAELTRAHNDSNMLILGAGFIEEKEALAIVEAWVKTPFEGGRHERRVDKIKAYESGK